MIFILFLLPVSMIFSAFAVLVANGIGFLIFGFFVYRFFIKPFRYWKKRGVVYKKPNRIFGHLKPFIFQQKSLVDLNNDIYSEYSNERYVGLYHFSSPVLLLRNPDLIDRMIRKHFPTFHERTTFIPREVDPIWGKGLFALPGLVEWKQTRTVVTTLLTAKKLQEIFYSIQNCLLSLDDHIEMKTENGQATLLATDIFGGVANDIIAKVSVGKDCNSFSEPNNEILALAKNISGFKGVINSMRFFIVSFSTRAAKWINTRFINEIVVKSFGKIIEESEIHENKLNLIDVMAEYSDGWARLNASNASGDDEEYSPMRRSMGSYFFSVDDVIAQVVVFFAGGFDTLRRAISYAAYELAINPEIQKRLLEEVNDIYQSSKDNLSYDDIKKMKYMNMVVLEALRKWPPIAVADRKVAKKFKIYDTENRTKYVEIDEEVVCLVPIFAIHRDPNYYPDPETFNPDRFNPENRSKITSKIYFPFGIGRRACVGEALSLMIIKTVLFCILRKYKIEPVEETPIPIVLSRSCVNPEPSKPLILGFRRRNL